MEAEEGVVVGHSIDAELVEHFTIQDENGVLICMDCHVPIEVIAAQVKT